MRWHQCFFCLAGLLVGNASWAGTLTIAPSDEAQGILAHNATAWQLLDPAPNALLRALAPRDGYSDEKRGYLEFSLEGISQGVVVTSISLRVLIGERSQTFAGPWGPARYSQFNVGLFDGQDGMVTLADVGRPVFASSLTQPITGNGNFYYFDLGVAAFNQREALIPSGNLGIVLTDAQGGFLTSVLSGDDPNHNPAPTLIVEYTAVPLPAGWEIGGAGLVTLIAIGALKNAVRRGISMT